METGLPCFAKLYSEVGHWLDLSVSAVLRNKIGFSRVFMKHGLLDHPRVRQPHSHTLTDFWKYNSYSYGWSHSRAPECQQGCCVRKTEFSPMLADDNDYVVERKWVAKDTVQWWWYLVAVEMKIWIRVSEDDKWATSQWTSRDVDSGQWRRLWRARVNSATEEESVARPLRTVKYLRGLVINVSRSSCT